MGIEINLNGLKKRIAGMEAAALHVAVDMVNELSLVGAEQAKALAPVDSTNLAVSIHTFKTERVDDEVSGGYGTILEYAPYVEYGTGRPGESGAVANGQEKDPDASIAYTQLDYWRYQDANGNWHTTHGQPARPYMYPSAKAVEEELPGILEKYGKQIVGGDGGA